MSSEIRKQMMEEGPKDCYQWCPEYGWDGHRKYDCPICMGIFIAYKKLVEYSVEHIEPELDNTVFVDTGAISLSGNCVDLAHLRSDTGVDDFGWEAEEVPMPKSLYKRLEESIKEEADLLAQKMAAEVDGLMLGDSEKREAAMETAIREGWFERENDGFIPINYGSEPITMEDTWIEGQEALKDGKWEADPDQPGVYMKRFRVVGSAIGFTHPLKDADDESEV